MGFLKQFDHLSSPSKDFTVKTSNGGILTILTILISLHLIYTVTLQSFTVRTLTRTFSNSTLHQPLEVEFDLSFPHINCNLIHVDAQDTTGQTQSLHLDRQHHVYKRRLNKMGVPVGGRRKHKLGGTFTEEASVARHFGLDPPSPTAKPRDPKGAGAPSDDPLGAPSDDPVKAQPPEGG
ncbi:hypothetical protein TrRE_jg10363, partial [Triparma retinervis]